MNRPRTNPVWYQQPEAKHGIKREKRELQGKTSQRLGRLARISVANTTLVTHGVTSSARGGLAKVGSKVHAGLAQGAAVVAPGLRELYEKKVVEVVDPSKPRRLGLDALLAVGITAEHIALKSAGKRELLKQRAEQIKYDTDHQIGEGQLVTAARKYKDKHTRREGDVTQRALTVYRAKHPEIADQERGYRWEVAEHQSYVYERTVFDKTADLVESFSNESPEFFKSIPPRYPQGEQDGLSGSYFGLAKYTLKNALSERQPDGSIPLLGQEVQSRLFMKRLQEKKDMGLSATGNDRTGSQHVGGVAATIMELGFVGVDEDNLPDGYAVFNPFIEWEDDGEVTRARIPYDPSNKLHTMLRPERRAVAGQMIELKMPNKYSDKWAEQDPYLNLSVV